MKRLTLIAWVCLSVIPAFAQGNQGGNGQGNQGGNGQGQNGGGGYHGAPAPLLGLGIPSAAAVGGVLLGAKLLRRRRG